MNVNSRKSKAKRREKNGLKDRIIKRQVDEIESLKNRISKLEIDNKTKDDIINSIDAMRLELLDVIGRLNDKSDEYDELIAEMKEMRDVFNQEVFRGRWRLIRFLMR